MAPPKNILRMQISFPMPCITAPERGFPKPAGQLLSGDITPAHIEIPFISNLIPHHRFSVTLPQFVGILYMAVQILPLQAAMGDSRPGKIIKLYAVMDRTQMVVGVLFTQDGGIVLPILQGFGFHQIILVGQAPPHIPISRISGCYIIPVQVIGLSSHIRKSPAIIRMHDNDIRLQPSVPKLLYSPVDAPKMLRAKTGKIPLIP